ncbi:MAG TPA: hypothetical protein VG897_12815 [Terriglobales bacterium]|nr:hypothetical protein [Terriglobales bacterium]
MANISSLLTVLVALSMASERVIELLKKILPAGWLANDWKIHEQLRQALLQILAGVIGGLTAWASHAQIAAMIPTMAQFLHWPAYVLLGAMSSAGSGFWNHILDAVRAIKIEREVRAELQVRQLNAERKQPDQLEFRKSATAA